MFRGSRRITRLTAVAVAWAIASMTAGCGYSARNAQAEKVIHAADVLAARRTASGTVSLTVSLDKIVSLTSATTKPIPAIPGAAKALKPTLSAPPHNFDLDFTSRRAIMTPAPATSPAPKPATGQAVRGGPAGPDIGGLAALGGAANVVAAAVPQVFDGGIIYLHVAKAPAADDAADAQVWFRLDFGELDKANPPDLQTLPLIDVVNPTYLLGLLRGTLSGSVKERGTAQVDGVPTTKYEVNLDLDKATRRMHNKDRVALENALAANHITGSIFKHADVWLDAQGAARKVVLPLKQEITQNKVTAVFKLTITLDLHAFGAPVAIPLPDRDSTGDVSSLNELYGGVAS